MIVATCLILQCVSDIPEHRINTLPGLESPLPTPQWSGYIDVDGLRGETVHVHYHFIEAENPSTAPIVSWSNGGPGSSSMMGLFTENGPVTLNDDSFNTDSYNKTGIPSVFLNPQSWHLAPANMLFIDHPAPTGFSYCTPSCSKFNDSSQAVVFYRFMVAFFEKYPKFVQNDFYMSGESYAGVLVPTTALEILKYKNNENKNQNPYRIQGLILGNDCAGTRVETCTPYSGWVGTKTKLDFLYGHGMVKEQTYQKALKICENQWGTYDPPQEPCRSFLETAEEPLVTQSGNFEDTGGYFLYETCNDLTRNYPAQEKWSPPSRGYILRSGEVGADKPPRYDLNAGEYACGQERASLNYLNRADVQKALHVKPQKFTWGTFLSYDFTAYSLVEDYRKTLIPNLRILQYSGDADPCVPYTGTQRWIDSMNLNITNDWHPYTAPHEQFITGYAVEYAVNGFTFATIRGSGHMVPRFKPKQMFYVFQSFLKKKAL